MLLQSEWQNEFQLIDKKKEIYSVSSCPTTTQRTSYIPSKPFQTEMQKPAVSSVQVANASQSYKTTLGSSIPKEGCSLYLKKSVDSDVDTDPSGYTRCENIFANGKPKHVRNVFSSDTTLSYGCPTNGKICDRSSSVTSLDTRNGNYIGLEEKANYDSEKQVFIANATARAGSLCYICANSIQPKWNSGVKWYKCIRNFHVKCIIKQMQVTEKIFYRKSCQKLMSKSH